MPGMVSNIQTKVARSPSPWPTPRAGSPCQNKSGTPRCSRGSCYARPVIRRVHLRQLQTGLVALDPVAVHHIRDVLRMNDGDEIELFDDAGRTAIGRIAKIGIDGVDVSVGPLNEPVRSRFPLTVASAIPKGDRADWMVEKLSELGVDRFVPLETARGVVVPGGKNKFQRWERLAVESAKQSRRPGVMRIDPLTTLEKLLQTGTGGLILSTSINTRPIGAVTLDAVSIVLIGPEGGWTESELAAAEESGFVGTALTETILRVETAAVTAAGVILCGRKNEPRTDTDELG